MSNKDILKDYFNKKKALITGGAGFVGSHTAEELLKLGAEVTILDNLYRGRESRRNLKEIKDAGFKFNFIEEDVMNFPALKKAMEKKDLVFHFAALPSHRLALKEPKAYAEVDIIGTVNVLDVARAMSKKPKILFASSNKVYGKQNPPFKESDSPAPEGPYGQAKINSEEWCKQYSKYYDVPGVICRLHHVIGPRSQPDLALSIFVERIIEGKKPIVHGDFRGKKFISCAAAFTNIHDSVEGILLSMAKVDNFDVLNIGASKETEVLEIAQIAREILDSDVGIQKKQMHKHESLHHAADPSKAKRLLGWEANTPAKESVRQYIQWRLATGKRKSAKYKKAL